MHNPGKSFAFCFACLLMLSISSCKKDELECVNEAGWLQTGHQWVYEFSSPYIYADTIALTVDGEVSPGVFKVSTVADDTALYMVAYKYMRPCHNDIYISSDSAMNISFVTYKVDGEVGETWHYDLPTTGGFVSTIHNTIVAKDEMITVPAGTFSCLVVHEEITSTDPRAQYTETNYYLNNEHGIIMVISNTQEYSLVRKNY